VVNYAVDINGTLVDAVVVEKEKARKAFETETRQFEKTQAAIVDSVVGNVFKTKVNLIKPNSERKVHLTISKTLDFKRGYN
jgi:pantothenate kinase